MKKLGLLFLTIIIISSCVDQSTWEEKDFHHWNVECLPTGDNIPSKYFYNYNYKLGFDLGVLSGLSTDGKMDCKWGKDRAIKLKFYDLYRKPPKYNDCWCRGYIEGYSEAKFRLIFGE